MKESKIYLSANLYSYKDNRSRRILRKMCKDGLIKYIRTSGKRVIYESDKGNSKEFFKRLKGDYERFK